MSVGLGAGRRPGSRVSGGDWPRVLEYFQQTVSRIVIQHGGTIVALDGDTVLARFSPDGPAGEGCRSAVQAGRDIVRAVDRLAATVPASFGAGDLKGRVGVHAGGTPVAGGAAPEPAPAAPEPAPAAPVPAGPAVPDPASPSGPSNPAEGEALLEIGAIAARLRSMAGPGDVLLSEVVAERVRPSFDLTPVLLHDRPLHDRPLPDPPFRDRPGAGFPGAVYRVVRARQRPGRGAARPLIPFVARQEEMAWLERRWRSSLRGPPRTVLIEGEPGIGKSRLVLEFAASLGASGSRFLAIACRHDSALTPLQPFASVMGAAPDGPRAAESWLEACAAFGPTLVIVEDAQWADPTTLEVIDRMAGRDLPLMVVLTARPGTVDGPQSDLPAEQRLVLDRLPAAAARTMVDLVLGGDLVGPDLIDDLVERADGVPLYIEELARNASLQAPGEGGAIPPTLMKVIDARLQRLGDTRAVAQMASVMGREFECDVVGRLCGLDDETFEKHLLRLLDEAIVDGDEGRDGSLRFRHALIHQAAYESLGPGDRRRAHSFLADALVARGRPGSEPQLVAYHLTEAGRYGEAVAMWRNAARLARRRSRFKEAVGHERKILALLPHMAEDHRDSVELKARSRLAMCLTAVDQSAPEILGEATRAQDLARAYGDERTVLDTYLILLPWWQARADYDAIEAALPEVRRLARQVADPAYAHSLLMVEASVRIWQGRLAEGLGQLGDMFEQSGIPLRESLRSLPPVSAPTVLMRCSSRVAAALGFWLTGDARSAWQLVDDALLFAIERGVTAAQAVSCATAALIAQLDGDRSRSAGYAAQAAQASAETATVQWRRWGAALQLWAGGRAGEIEIPGLMLGPYFQMLATDDERASPASVIAALDEALETARRRGERFCEAEILRHRGRAWHRAGRPERAAADLAEATGTARSQLARSLELKALTDRVALLGDGGARPRLARLVSSLGVDGPGHSLGKAQVALGPTT